MSKSDDFIMCQNLVISLISIDSLSRLLRRPNVGLVLESLDLVFG